MACEVTPPEGGIFDDRDVTIETGSVDCDTGMCMVYALHGDPSAECVEALIAQ